MFKLIRTLQFLAAGTLAVFASSALAANGSIFASPVQGFMPDFYANEVVKNAPVSARITTRSVQTLYDGNRIVHEDVVQFYRDSEGRIRRERLAKDSGRAETVSISDPVLKRTVFLNTASKVAFKAPQITDLIMAEGVGRMGTVMIGSEEGNTIALSGAGDSSLSVMRAEGDTPVAVATLTARPDGLPAAGSNGTMALSGAVRMVEGVAVGSGRAYASALGSHRGWNTGSTEVVSLGQDVVDGVRVEGTSYTTTYPANAFGNEMPIVVEKETWFAPELRMMVRTKEQDPRTGTITYEAEMIDTREPDAALFAVPSDYTLVEPGRAN